MVPRLLAVAISLAASSVAFAQTDGASAPKTMLGFLKPGMHVGVTSVEGTTSVILRTYTEEHYTVVQELKAHASSPFKPASSVAENNAYVSARLQEYASAFNLPEDVRDRILIALPIRTSFGTVAAVGDDYVLLDLDDEHSGRRIIPKASMGTIYLDANPVNFIDPAARGR